MTSTRAELGSPIPSRQAEELAANDERGANFAISWRVATN
jgi:hypothetical protein